MTVRNWALALMGALLFASLPGCIISVNSSHNPYDLCSPGDTCTSRTSCLAANTTVNPGTTSGVNFCTYASCSVSADCPADTGGFGVLCVALSPTAPGQCYRACGPGNTCPSGFTCGGSGTSLFCVPGTAASTCGAGGQSCCSGSQPCNSGLVCGSGGTCGVPLCGNSGQTCCAGSQPCAAGLACSGGVCVTAASCGLVGQACCSGGTCDPASGAACGSDGLCGLAPYSGCSGGSIGQSCLGGLNSSSQVIATTCQIPMTANPGLNGFCTAACAGSATMCPTWVGATRSYTYNCYLLQGAVNGNCFIDCPAGEACPANTICAMTPVMGGSPVRLCMPMPS